MANVKKSVWIGELERFGYNLVAVGATEEEVRKALSREYIRAYKDINGCDPRKEALNYIGTVSYYDNAMEDIYIRELKYGEVEWA